MMVLCVFQHLMVRSTCLIMIHGLQLLIVATLKLGDFHPTAMDLRVVNQIPPHLGLQSLHQARNRSSPSFLTLVCHHAGQCRHCVSRSTAAGVRNTHNCNSQRFRTNTRTYQSMYMHQQRSRSISTIDIINVLLIFLQLIKITYTYIAIVHTCQPQHCCRRA
jgi:hypothetical protein